VLNQPSDHRSRRQARPHWGHVIKRRNVPCFGLGACVGDRTTEEYWRGTGMGEVYRASKRSVAGNSWWSCRRTAWARVEAKARVTAHGTGGVTSRWNVVGARPDQRTSLAIGLDRNSRQRAFQRTRQDGFRSLTARPRVGYVGTHRIRRTLIRPPDRRKKISRRLICQVTAMNVGGRRRRRRHCPRTIPPRY